MVELLAGKGSRVAGYATKTSKANIASQSLAVAPVVWCLVVRRMDVVRWFVPIHPIHHLHGARGLSLDGLTPRSCS